MKHAGFLIMAIAAAGCEIAAPAATTEMGTVEVADAVAATTDSTATCLNGAGNQPRGWHTVNSNTETDPDGYSYASHAVSIGITPLWDEACNKWRIVVPEGQANSIIDGITVVRDIAGTYVDADGVTRTTRAWRDGGWVIEASEGTSDRREDFWLDCDSDFSGFAANRAPATDIAVQIAYTIQWAERDNATPARVRPFDRTGTIGVICPVPTG